MKTYGTVGLYNRGPKRAIHAGCPIIWDLELWWECNASTYILIPIPEPRPIMDDICIRLRNLAREWRGCEVFSMSLEAADKIDNLRLELKTLKEPRAVTLKEAGKVIGIILLVYVAAGVFVGSVLSLPYLFGLAK